MISVIFVLLQLRQIVGFLTAAHRVLGSLVSGVSLSKLKHVVLIIKVQSVRNRRWLLRDVPLYVSVYVSY